MGKRGPVPSDQFKGKTAAFSTRITPQTRDRLAKAAKVSGRSISHEAEARLTASFEPATGLESDFGSSANFGLALLVAKAISDVETWTDMQWSRDRYTYEQCKIAAAEILAAFQPADGSPDDLPESFPAWPGYGIEIGADLIESMAADMLKIGLGKACAHQNIARTQNVSKMAGVLLPSEELPAGSDYRIALEASSRVGKKITVKPGSFEATPMHQRDEILMTSGLWKRRGKKSLSGGR